MEESIVSTEDTPLLIQTSHSPSATEGVARRRPRWLGLGLLLLILLGLGWWEASRERGPAPPPAADPVLAVVNGAPLTRADLERQMRLEAFLFELATDTPLPGSDEGEALSELIAEELMWQAAVEAGISVGDEEIEGEIRERLAASEMEAEALGSRLAAAGLTVDDLQWAMRRILAIRRTIETRVWAGVPEEEHAAALLRWTEDLERRATIERPVASSGAAPVVGAMAPDFTLTTLDGQEITLSSLRGRAVLVNFWATWCPPCRLEMPYLQAAYERHRDHGLVVLAVDIQESPETVRAFVEEFGLSFPIPMDETGMVTSSLYRVQGIPTSFFVNREGVITDRHVGPMNEEIIETYLANVL